SPAAALHQHMQAFARGGAAGGQRRSDRAREADGPHGGGGGQTRAHAQSTRAATGAGLSESRARRRAARGSVCPAWSGRVYLAAMTATLHGSILERIGSTPLVELRSLVPAGGARVLVKIESENPTGSMKDRMALAMIEAAESNGRLAPGGSVVEYTAGSTGVSLSLVCGVKRYPLHIVTSDAFAQEKLDHMALLGARLRVLKSESGRMTEKLTRDMIEAARI